MRRTRKTIGGRGIPKIRKGKIYFGRGIPKARNNKIYFGKGYKQRGGGDLSKLLSKIIFNVGDAISI